MEQEQQYINITDAAAELGVGRKRIYNALKKLDIEPVKQGVYSVISTKELERIRSEYIVSEGNKEQEQENIGTRMTNILSRDRAMRNNSISDKEYLLLQQELDFRTKQLETKDTQFEQFTEAFKQQLEAKDKDLRSDKQDLKEQLHTKDQQLDKKDEQLAAMDKQLKELRESYEKQLQAKDAQLNKLLETLSNQESRMDAVMQYSVLPAAAVGIKQLSNQSNVETAVTVEEKEGSKEGHSEGKERRGLFSKWFKK